MKFKIALLITFGWICQHSFSQVNSQNLASTDSDQKNEVQISKTIYNKKEWKKIKRQIQKNKKKISKNKYQIYPHKTIDTIYLEIPYTRTTSRLTDW